MGFIKDSLILVLGVIAGVSMIKYRERIVRIVGKTYYAEKYLGGGGSYTMWILLGIVVIFGTIWYIIKK